VDLLLKHSVLPNQESVNRALTEATLSGHLPILQRLLNSRAVLPDVSAITEALHSAVGGNQSECVEVLLQHAPEQLNAALMFAAEIGNIPFVEQFCCRSQGTNMIDDALRLAARNGHLSVITRLLGRHSATSNGIDDALYEAACNRHTLIVHYLMQYVPSKSGVDRAAKWAAVHGHTDIADLILKRT
jgi:hypothetical protein